ncbi:PorV/PorQ family protein [Elusimicrobiota bacterium]
MLKYKRRLKYFLAVMLISISVSCLYGQSGGGGDDSGAGGASALFLQFNPSAKATGMGEAFVAISDINSITHNPGGLGFLRYKEGSFVHSELYQGNKINFFAGALPLKKITLAAHLLSFSTPSEPVYDWSGEETGEEITYSGVTAGIAGSIKLNDNISAGIGIKSVKEGICELDDTAMGFDVGGFASYPMSDGILQLGISMSNLGVNLRDEEDPPVVNRIGAAYIWDEFTASAEVYDARGNDGAEFHLGGQYCIQEIFSPRAGVKFGAENEVITMGFGFEYRNYYLDYAYNPNSILGAMHKIGLGAKLGVPLEELAKKPGKTRKRTPVKLKRNTDDLLNIAVAELSGKNVSAMDAAIVSDFIRTELVRTRTFKVLDRQNMEQLLEEQSFQMTGCTTEECAVQMGKVLNVSYMVVGTFSKFLETYYVNVNFVDVETGEIVAAESAECASGKELPEAAKKISDSFAEQFSR